MSASPRLEAPYPRSPGRRAAPGSWAACSFASVVLLSLLAPPAEAQGACLRTGDVDADGAASAADANLAFQAYLGTADPLLGDCALRSANLAQPLGSGVTPGDAQCILQQAEGSASCLGAATITAAGGSLASGDGRVAIGVPPNALAGDTVISVAPLDPGDIPAELSSVPSLFAYELQPGGLQFAFPADVFVALDPAAPGLGPELAVLFTSADGAAEPLLALTQTFGDEQFVELQGQLEHFSPLVATLVDGVTATLDGVVPALAPGDKMLVHALVAQAATSPVSADQVRYEDDNSVFGLIVEDDARIVPEGSFDMGSLIPNQVQALTFTNVQYECQRDGFDTFEAAIALADFNIFQPGTSVPLGRTAFSRSVMCGAFAPSGSNEKDLTVDDGFVYSATVSATPSPMVTAVVGDTFDVVLREQLPNLPRFAEIEIEFGETVAGIVSSPRLLSFSGGEDFLVPPGPPLVLRVIRPEADNTQKLRYTCTHSGETLLGINFAGTTPGSSSAGVTQMLALPVRCERKSQLLMHGQFAIGDNPEEMVIQQQSDAFGLDPTGVHVLVARSFGVSAHDAIGGVPSTGNVGTFFDFADVRRLEVLRPTGNVDYLITGTDFGSLQSPYIRQTGSFGLSTALGGTTSSISRILGESDDHRYVSTGPGTREVRFFELDENLDPPIGRFLLDAARTIFSGAFGIGEFPVFARSLGLDEPTMVVTVRDGIEDGWLSQFSDSTTRDDLVNVGPTPNSLDCERLSNGGNVCMVTDPETLYVGCQPEIGGGWTFNSMSVDDTPQGAGDLRPTSDGHAQAVVAHGDAQLARGYTIDVDSCGISDAGDMDAEGCEGMFNVRFVYQRAEDDVQDDVAATCTTNGLLVIGRIPF